MVEPAELRAELAAAGFATAPVDHPIASFRAICARRPPVAARMRDPALAGLNGS